MRRQTETLEHSLRRTHDLGETETQAASLTIHSQEHLEAQLFSLIEKTIPDTENNDGNKIKDVAAIKENVTAIRQCILNGVNTHFYCPSPEDSQTQYTPLGMAILRQKSEVVELLLSTPTTKLSKAMTSNTHLTSALSLALNQPAPSFNTVLSLLLRDTDATVYLDSVKKEKKVIKKLTSAHWYQWHKGPTHFYTREMHLWDILEASSPSVWKKTTGSYNTAATLHCDNALDAMKLNVFLQENKNLAHLLLLVLEIKTLFSSWRVYLQQIPDIFEEKPKQKLRGIASTTKRAIARVLAHASHLAKALNWPKEREHSVVQSLLSQYYKNIQYHVRCHRLYPAGPLDTNDYGFIHRQSLFNTLANACREHWTLMAPTLMAYLADMDSHPWFYRYGRLSWEQLSYKTLLHSLLTYEPSSGPSRVADRMTPQETQLTVRSRLANLPDPSFCSEKLSLLQAFRRDPTTLIEKKPGCLFEQADYHEFYTVWKEASSLQAGVLAVLGAGNKPSTHGHKMAHYRLLHDVSDGPLSVGTLLHLLSLYYLKLYTRQEDTDKPWSLSHRLSFCIAQYWVHSALSASNGRRKTESFSPPPSVSALPPTPWFGASNAWTDKALHTPRDPLFIARPHNSTHLLGFLSQQYRAVSASAPLAMQATLHDVFEEATQRTARGEHATLMEASTALWQQLAPLMKQGLSDTQYRAVAADYEELHRVHHLLFTLVRANFIDPLHQRIKALEFRMGRVERHTGVPTNPQETPLGPGELSSTLARMIPHHKTSPAQARFFERLYQSLIRFRLAAEVLHTEGTERVNESESGWAGHLVDASGEGVLHHVLSMVAENVIDRASTAPYLFPNILAGIASGATLATVAIGGLLYQWCAKKTPTATAISERTLKEKHMPTLFKQGAIVEMDVQIQHLALLLTLQQWGLLQMLSDGQTDAAHDIDTLADQAFADVVHVLYQGDAHLPVDDNASLNYRLLSRMPSVARDIDMTVSAPSLKHRVNLRAYQTECHVLCYQSVEDEDEPSWIYYHNPHEHNSCAPIAQTTRPVIMLTPQQLEDFKKHLAQPLEKGERLSLTQERNDSGAVNPAGKEHITWLHAHADLSSLLANTVSGQSVKDSIGACLAAQKERAVNKETETDTAPLHTQLATLKEKIKNNDIKHTGEIAELRGKNEGLEKANEGLEKDLENVKTELVNLKQTVKEMPALILQQLRQAAHSPPPTTVGFNPPTDPGEQTAGGSPSSIGSVSPRSDSEEVESSSDPSLTQLLVQSRQASGLLRTVEIPSETNDSTEVRDFSGEELSHSSTANYEH